MSTKADITLKQVAKNIKIEDKGVASFIFDERGNIKIDEFKHKHPMSEVDELENRFQQDESKIANNESAIKSLDNKTTLTNAEIDEIKAVLQAGGGSGGGTGAYYYETFADMKFGI